MSSRIDAALALLAPHLLTTQEPHSIRSLLEDLYDGAQDDLMNDLIDTNQAAAIWDVTERRASAHILRLHEKYGIGRQLGGAWVLRRAHAEAYKHDQKYRRKDT